MKKSTMYALRIAIVCVALISGTYSTAQNKDTFCLDTASYWRLVHLAEDGIDLQEEIDLCDSSLLALQRAIEAKSDQLEITERMIRKQAAVLSGWKMKLRRVLLIGFGSAAVVELVIIATLLT